MTQRVMDTSVLPRAVTEKEKPAARSGSSRIADLARRREQDRLAAGRRAERPPFRGYLERKWPDAALRESWLGGTIAQYEKLRGRSEFKFLLVVMQRAI